MQANTVSLLHNTHLVKVGQDLVGNTVVIAFNKLQDMNTVNDKSRDIVDGDLVLSNIFVTNNETHLMLSCYVPELIVVKSSQFNCSQNPIHVLKADASRIMTSKGNVEEHMIFKFKLE